eukprot:comp23143_c0_seq1/m.37362 comp23143_c0_seq1/g.37362  ORF comp23143_c0_seq1/g.37362 comp23143_c0_seq1/m.37362 type:complete len:505 (-) comp23143_c0_seq1:471-1985(-)
MKPRAILGGASLALLSSRTQAQNTNNNNNNVVSLYPNMFRITNAYTGSCMSTTTTPSEVRFSPCEMATPFTQLWQLASTGLVVTGSSPYLCLSAGVEDGSAVSLVQCNPFAPEQIWATSGTGFGAVPQLANSRLNSCVAECKNVKGALCAYRPANLPPGSCRTLEGSASNTNMKADVRTPGGVPAPVPGPPSVAPPALQPQSSSSPASQPSAPPAVVTTSQLQVPASEPWNAAADTTTTRPTVVNPGWTPPVPIITVTRTATINGQQFTITALQPADPYADVSFSGQPVNAGPVPIYDDGLSVGTIVAITIGVVVGLTLLILLAVGIYFQSVKDRAYAEKLNYMASGLNEKKSFTSTNTAATGTNNAQTRAQNTSYHPRSAGGYAPQEHAYGESHNNHTVHDVIPGGKTSILLECAHATDTDYIAMVGGRESLGAWDPFRAPAMTRHPDNPSLFILTIANVTQTPLPYKFAKISADHTVTWMSGDNLILQPAAGDVTQAYIWEL